MKNEVVAGIDIGGTKIAVSLETVEGAQIAARRLPTQVHLGPHRILENVCTAIEEMLAGTGGRLAAVGIGCPGPIDIERGITKSPTNLPDWDDFPLVELIEKRFGAATILDNDANAAALGEYHYGAGRGFKDVLYVTISTGIGGAVICDGKIVHGVGASAGEIGHTIVKPDGVPCRCGTAGCLETIGSGTSIARRARERLAQNGPSVMRQMAASIEKVTAEVVVEAVRQSDRTACLVWDETIYFLAIGIGNAITLFAPEAVVIGGGVASAGELLFEPLRRQIRQNARMLPIEKVEILKASLGSESGVCGALMLARQAFRDKTENVY